MRGDQWSWLLYVPMSVRIQLCSAACCVCCHCGDWLTCGLHVTDALLSVVESCILVCLSVNTQAPRDLLLGGINSSPHPMLATVCVWGENREQRAPASHVSCLCVHVMHLQLPHLSVISSVRAPSCWPRGMAHMCLTAVPPALLNLSFPCFAVLSLFSFILQCQSKQDHHSVGDWPQIQRAEGLAPRSVRSRPQCPVDCVCVSVCVCKVCVCKVCLL